MLFCFINVFLIGVQIGIVCLILYIFFLQEVIGKQAEEEHEDEEEFNDAVVSFGEERIHNATHSKLSHVYIAGGRTYRAMEAMEDR